tara:strand:+ start:214 stop:579 length:366 start_codon:yes stop_codon:yes gene_type:complete
MNIKTFIAYTITNKESQMLCKEYLKSKRLEFERNETKKTIHNCLYKLSYSSSRRWGSPTIKQIVKIKRAIPCPRKGTPYSKIYYWVISDMGIIYNKNKKTFCIYPDWTSTKLEDDNFIPFY